MPGRHSLGIVVAAVLAPPASAGFAGEVTVTINRISADGMGAAIGAITLKDTAHGMTVTPRLRGLPPGKHAKHIHEHPNCGAGMKGGKKVAGLMAGGHYDPAGTLHAGQHSHSMTHGQRAMHGAHSKPHGDLPELVAAADGTASAPVATKKLKVAQVIGRAIMIPRYGENAAGERKGGGPRYAWGVSRS
jgi:Cu-Zn family superoxide dismutase